MLARLLCVFGLFGGLLWAAPNAHAHNVEAGRLAVGAGVGPGLSFGNQLGTSPADFLFVLSGDYTFTRMWSATGAALAGVGGTTPLMGRLGVRARAHSLGLAISPYAQLEFVGGGLMRVLGSHQRYLGTRAGVGVEYFATSDLSVGVGVGVSLGGTLGERPAFYGLADGMVYMSFALNKSAGESVSSEAALLPTPADAPAE